MNQKINCSKHKNKKCEYLLISDTDEKDIFLCQTCLDLKTSESKVIRLKDIKNKEINTSWPFIDNRNLLIQYVQINDDPEIQQKKINDFADKCSQEIINQVQSVFKEMRSNAYLDIDKLKKTFEETLQMDKIHQIFYGPDNNNQIQQYAEDNLPSKSKSTQFFEITTKLRQEQAKNTEILQNILEGNYGFDKERYETLQQYIMKQISLFDFKLIKNCQDKVAEIRNKKEFMRKDSSLQKGGNLDKILSFVENKANQCSSSYLESLKSELLKIQTLINDLPISLISHDQGKKKLDFDITNLKQEQIDDLHKLINKMNDLNTVNNDSKIDQHKVCSIKQKDSNFILAQIKHLKNLFSKEKLDLIEKQLRTFPIFESLNLVDLVPYNFVIEPSNYEFSKSNLIIQEKKIMNKESRKTISYIKVPQESLCIVNFQINNIQCSQYLNFQLVCEENKDQQISNSEIQKYLEGLLNRANNQQNQSIKELEIQFCVKNNFFQIRERNKNNSITKNFDLKLLDDVVYFFTIHLYYQNLEITFSEFLEVKQVEKKV